MADPLSSESDTDALLRTAVPPSRAPPMTPEQIEQQRQGINPLANLAREYFMPAQAMRNPDTPESRQAYAEAMARAHEAGGGKVPPIPGSEMFTPGQGMTMDLLSNVGPKALAALKVLSPAAKAISAIHAGDPLSLAMAPFAKPGMLGVRETKLKSIGNMSQVVLEETTQPVQRFEAGLGRRNFRMKMGDQDLGGIAIDTRYPDQPYVDLIENYEGGGPNSLGDAVIRQVLRALFQEFPEAKKITGHRISGAREAAGRTAVTAVPKPGSQELVPPEEISVKQMGTHSPYAAAEYAGKPYFVAHDKRGSLPGDYITANSEEDALNIARARRYKRFINR